MKKIVLLLFTCLLMSCAMYNDITNVVEVKDYSEKMKILKYGFPEVYDLYKSGAVILDEVYTYTDRKTGKEKTHIGYHYR